MCCLSARIDGCIPASVLCAVTLDSADSSEAAVLTLLWENCSPVLSQRMSTADMTAAKLCRGSPMPINTMFVMGGRGAAPGSPRAAALDSREARRKASTTCSTIWAVLSWALRSKHESAQWTLFHLTMPDASDMCCPKDQLVANRRCYTLVMLFVEVCLVHPWCPQCSEEWLVGHRCLLVAC